MTCPATSTSQPSASTEMEVDFSQPIGQIRPLHGINNGPVNYGGLVDVSDYHRALRAPLVRLHDCHWPNPDVVDIHCIFPRLDADTDDPGNYHFEKTDHYIQSIVDLGIPILYRLGESIEHSTPTYHNHPPTDYEQWAKVCVQIVRHYNEGWADGFHHNIRYWEVWNEPNLPGKSWTGTQQEFLDLYTMASKAVKAHDPSLNVGGPALCAIDAYDYMDTFLRHCRTVDAPVDFCSWHIYPKNPGEIKTHAEHYRTLLDEHGFTETENHINEWHYLGEGWEKLRLGGPVASRDEFALINGPVGAAFTASTLIDLQDSKIDMAFYYSACSSVNFSLFDRFGVPHAAYYGLKAFSLLRDTPNRVTCAGGDKDAGLEICAGLSEDSRQAQVLLSNFRAECHGVKLDLKHLPLKGPVVAEILAVDADHSLESIGRIHLASDQATLCVECPAPAIRLIQLNLTDEV